MGEKKNLDCHYKYYAMNDQNQLVYGFDDIQECKHYCNMNNYRMRSKLLLQKQKFDVEDLNNWSNIWIEPGVV